MRYSRTEAVYKETLWPWSVNVSAVFEIKKKSSMPKKSVTE